ncbi:MAG: hypothetical protein M1540_00210 [Candidatus Bathyarchaeota archaeon]|nr:hypothetical protein [Candidatus Bathyarchaeota archaeon]
MKTKRLLTLSLFLCFSLLTLPTLAYEPSIGVKEGDWIEYNISVSGKGSPPPTHDVRWMRITVLEVDRAAFSINLTAQYANGTEGSAIWKFNFTEGNVGGWIIIPASLGVGDTFFDSSIHNHKPVNVTIQGESQKTVLGAARVVTFGNDSFRHKEWDRATGVFVGSSETYRNVTNKDGWYIEDLTVTIEAAATNMWNPKTILGLNPTLFYGLIVGTAVAVLLPAAILVARRRKATLSPKQKKIFGIILLAAFVVTIGAIAITPMSESQVPLSFREINLLMQTMWTGLVLVSMWFRKKGNYIMHEIVMLVVVSATVVSFSAVLVMTPPSSGSWGDYFSSTANVVAVVVHSVVSVPAIAFGVWLVVLWRPNSATYAAKSRRAAQLTAVFWVLSYVVGVLDFVLLRMTLIG